MNNLLTDGHPPELVERSVRALLDETRLCSVATLNPDGSPYINTCFFAYSFPRFIYVLTPPTAQHSRNIQNNPSVALSIFDSHQNSGDELRGIQLFGRCKELTSADEQAAAFSCYTDRFKNIIAYAADIDTMLKVFESRLFVISIDRFKIFDEPTFGKEVWVSAQVET